MPTRPPIHRPRWAKDPATVEAERQARYNATRPTAHQQGYDADWRALRAAFLDANPLCIVAGCGRYATDVDHVHDVRTHPRLRLVWSNLRSMCHEHHSERTAREQGFGRWSREQGGRGGKP